MSSGCYNNDGGTTLLLGDNCGQLKSISVDLKRLIENAGVSNPQDASLIPSTTTILTSSHYLQPTSDPKRTIKRIFTFTDDTLRVLSFSIWSRDIFSYF